MTIKSPSPLLPPNAQWFTSNGQPTAPFYQYMTDLDRAMRALALQGSSVAFANLPTGQAGDQRFVTDGRKAGEGAGSGTGVLAYFDGTNWIAVDTGSAVAA